MAKNGRSNKNLEQARQLKDTKQRYLWYSLLLVAIALVCLILQSLLTGSGVLNADSSYLWLAVYAVFLVLAAAIGTFTYKWSKASRALKEFLAQTKISESDL